MIFAMPLAWLQLIHQRVRFVVTIAGIAFVVILLFMQLGFQNALFESSVRVHQSLQGDLFLISSQYKALTAQQNFSRARLYQALASDGVESVRPVYMQFGKLKNIETGQKYAIFVFGVDPGQPIFNLPEVKQNLNLLKLTDTALFDRDSRLEFGPIAKEFDQGKPVVVEISEFDEMTAARRFKVRGLFGIGTSFGVDGNLIINSSAFLNTFSGRRVEEINIGLINLKPGFDPQQVRMELTRFLPNDVKILTFEEFSRLEKRYWDLRTPVGFIFKVMVTIGFTVGIGVAYQILYSNISNHLIEYATMKAIGFTNKYLLSTVFRQAVILALLGYIPGLIVSFGVYDIAANATSLPVIMTLNKSLTVLISVTFMCSISAAFAIQKLRAADPSDIF